MIHQSLESRWCICQTKGHDCEFMMAMVCSKGCFVDMLWGFDGVPCFQVNFGKYYYPMKFI